MNVLPRTALLVVAAVAPQLACVDWNGPDTTARELVFTTQPSAAPVGAIINPAVKVTVRDAQGNVATHFTGDVTVEFAANPSGSTLAGTRSRAAIAGVATFPDLWIDIGGDGYMLRASSATLPPATSVPFSVNELVVTPYTVGWFTSIDLESGVIGCPSFSYCPDLDIAIHYGDGVPHARVAQVPGVQIAHLTNRSFDDIHLVDAVAVEFTSALVDEPFDANRVILVRTAARGVFKLGNPVEYADSVRFDAARLN